MTRPSRSVRYRRWRRYPWWRTAAPVVSAYSDKLYARWRAADMPGGCLWGGVQPRPAPGDYAGLPVLDVRLTLGPVGRGETDDGSRR